MKTTIRRATEDDLPAILEIYRPYVLETAISSEYEVPTLAAFTERFYNVTSLYPWLVAEYAGEIVGYTYSSRIFERAGYRWNAYISVYVKPSYHRYGFATALYKTILDVMAYQGFHHIFAVVVDVNPNSTAFHEALGFTPDGRFANASFKHDAWHDVTWYRKTIRPCDEPPREIIPFATLTEEELAPFLRCYLDVIRK